MLDQRIDALAGQERDYRLPLTRHTGVGQRRYRSLAFLTVLVLAASMLFHGAPLEWITALRDAPPAVVIGVCVAYALLLAIPFVPAVEIGLLIMVLFGLPGVAGAYLATVAGLSLAYGFGRWFRPLDPASLPGVGPLYQRGRSVLPSCLPRQLLPVGTLALMLNLPGNALVGGGGGIALLYGATRGLSWPVFVLCTAGATAVVPLLFALGLVGAEGLLQHLE